MAIIKYDGGGRPGGPVKESISHDGGKTWNSPGSSGGNSGGSNRPSSGSSGSYTNNSGTTWNKYQGATGKQYEVAGSNGTISVTRPDGSTSLVRPTDSNYQATLNAMQSDLKGNGISYTPTHDFSNANGNWQTKDYITGNNDLKYALEQAAKNSGTGQTSTNDYVKSLYNRIGTQRGDGSVVTLDDVNKELGRLGLSDYDSNNAIYTAGGNLLPGNDLVKFGPDKTGDEGMWAFYGGQQYRTGGDQNDFVQYVNGKTGNLDNLSFLFGNMAGNKYAQQDPAYLAAYQQALGQFNQAANGGNMGMTGNQNVDNAINYINSIGNYYGITGGGYGGGSSLLDQIKELLGSGLSANKDFIAQQKKLAQQQAEQMGRSAWVNSQLQQDMMREGMSAMGLGTSGALQSAQLGVQSNYNNALGDINSNLNSMLSSLNAQELQMLSDYYDNMTQYAYNISNDEANRAMQQAQLAMQQQQMAYEQEMARQQLAMQQAQWDWQKQQAEYDRKLNQGSLYQDMYNSGMLSDMGYINAVSNLGLINAGYWPNGSASSGQTLGQMQRQQGVYDLLNAQLQNQLLQEQIYGKQLANQKKRSSGSSGSIGFDDSETTLGVASGVTPYQQTALWYTGGPSINPLNQMANYLIDNNIVKK